MLKVNFIAQNRDTVIKGLEKRNFKNISIIDSIIQSDIERRKYIKKQEELQASLNNISKEIGSCMKEGKKKEAETLKQQVTTTKGELSKIEKKKEIIEHELRENLLLIPNIPHKHVKKGNSEAENECIRETLVPPSFFEERKDHLEIAKELELIDFEAGVKITGAGFPVFQGDGAKLVRGLINFFLDKATENGYKEHIPPFIVNADSGFGTGQLPDKEGQMYHVTESNLYLIPTAEVPLTNIYRNTIIEEDALPIKITAYSPCFRREAGSYGKEVKGLNRVHQFDKVEIVQIEKPENSYKTLGNMVTYVSSLLDALELSYKIVRLCGGDLGFTATMTYDFEAFSSGQNKWLEVSSVSNFEEFQSERMKIRYKSNETKKNIPVHTLNGSALAIPRIVATILENNYKDGKVYLPKVLQPYVGKEYIEKQQP